MHASSGTAPASSGKVVARSWILGHNGFLWSCKVKIYILGVFGALCQFRRILPELAGAGYAITSNRITHQVLVIYVDAEEEVVASYRNVR